MAKKNRTRRGGGGGSSGAESSAPAAAGRPALLTVTAATPAADVLEHALASLDHIAEEHHRLRQKQQQPASLKRSREEAEEGDAPFSPLFAVHAAMSKPHFATVATAVAAFGLQLLPHLHDIVRRVGLAAGTPGLASAESWETAAMLCSYYGAGPAARMAEELLEALVREGGVFFFDAPCVAGQTAGGGAALLQKRPLGEVVGSGGAELPAELLPAAALAARKARALAEMILAAGPFVSRGLLQRAALRFAQEVVEGGILALSPASAAPPHSPLSSTPTHNNSNNNDNNNSTQQLFWRVPVVCHASCLAVLHSLLLLRGVPAAVAVCAGRVVAEATASLHRGSPVQPPASSASAGKEEGDDDGAVESASWYATWPAFVSYREVVAATVLLRQTLSLRHHPAALPLYTPPTYTEERITRKILLRDTQSQQQPQEEEEAKQPNDEAHDAPAPVVAEETPRGGPSAPLHPALAPPPPLTAPAAAAAPTPTPVKETAAVVVKGREEEKAAAPPRVYVAKTVSDGDESIPDIDMDSD